MVGIRLWSGHQPPPVRTRRGAPVGPVNPQRETNELLGGSWSGQLQHVGDT